MESFKIVIKQSHLRAVARAMAIKDVRSYLCGVLIESNGAEIRIIATDGCRIHGVIVETQHMQHTPVSFIIPSALVKQLINAKPVKQDTVLVINYDQVTKGISAALPDGVSISNTAIDGTFPTYRRIFEKSLKKNPSHYNPDYLVDLSASIKDYLGLSKSDINVHAITPHGGNIGTFLIDGFFAAVMPIRSDKVIHSEDSRIARVTREMC